MNAPEFDTTRRSRFSLRAALLQVHLYIALILGLFLITLGLTGSILVYGEAIEGWLAPAPHAQAAGTPQTPGAIAASARAARPGFLVGQITLPHEKGDAAMVRLAAAPRADGGAPQRPRPGPMVYVDPVSLAILGVRDGPALPWLRMMHDIHGNLLSGPVGRQVVGWLGVAMLVLGFSGLVLWWPKLRALKHAFTFNTKSRGAGFMREIHRFTGIWSLLAFLAVSFTGVAIVFPQTIAAGMHGVFGGGSKSEAPRGGFGAMPVSAEEIDAAVSEARAAMGNARLLSVAMPRAKNQPYRMNFASPTSAEDAPPIIVTVRTEEHRAQIRDPAQLALADRLIAWFRPAHEGQGLGPFWRAVVFAVGFLPLFFAFTGVWMWWVKRRMRLRRAP